MQAVAIAAAFQEVGLFGCPSWGLPG